MTLTDDEVRAIDEAARVEPLGLTSEATAPAEKPHRDCHYEAVGRRRLGNLPMTWSAYEFRMMGDGKDRTHCMMHFAPHRLKKSGKYKGRKTWDVKQRRQVLVSVEEKEAEERRYEAEDGKCYVCFGDGQDFASWSVEGGTRFRQCKRCNGTGKPPGEALRRLVSR